MVLAELRELAAALGVEDAARMRRSDLVVEIRTRQGHRPTEFGSSLGHEPVTGPPAHYRLDEPPGGTERRRRGGVSGMVLAELRELAGTLGVEDTTGMRRGDLIEEIRKRQTPALEEAKQADVPAEIDKLHDKSAEPIDPEDEPLDSSPGEGGLDALAAMAPMKAPPPPKARLLLALSVLLAPAERQNWRAELETARWEFRCDPRARRRASCSHLRHLLGAAWVSWRHGGHGSATELR